MKKILIVDDESITLRGLIYAINNNLICEISVAKDCSEAITLFRQVRFDIIILDLFIPTGDYQTVKDIVSNSAGGYFGLQLLKFFRQENREVRFIVHSLASIETNELRLLLQSANAAYVSKVSATYPDDLISIITSIQ